MSFLFCTCQPGSERVLKAEVARWRPSLRPAFARPGVVTFKSEEPLPLDLPAPLVFSRVTGVSFGNASSAEEVAARARELGARRLHVWERAGGPAPEVHAQLLATGAFVPEPRPRAGEIVVDVIAGEEGGPWLVGAHTHGPGRSPWPGGTPLIEVPSEAPSRAYRKLEEAIDWSGLRPRAGETALEIGSAPGGASYALLRRGLSVVGVDPGDMADVVARHPHFRHVKSAIGGVRRPDLPARVDWLLLDVNLAPQVALHAVRRIVPMIRAGLRGALFTLKLNEERFADEIPSFLARIREMGPFDARATQLPGNRREICVHAQRPR